MTTTIAAPPRPLVTFRVIIRETRCALRRTENIDLPSFGHPDLYRDQLLELPSEELAAIARDYVRHHTKIGHTLRSHDQLVVEPVVWAGVDETTENSILCRVRDSMEWFAWTQMRHELTNTRRRMVGIARVAS